MLSIRASIIVSYCTVHIIHCNSGRFKDDDDDDGGDDDDNKEYVFSNLHVCCVFLC
jgi:hypothetical protein